MQFSWSLVQKRTALMASQQIGTGMRMVMAFVRARFPTVPRITTDQLAKLMKEDKSSSELVLLDTREPEEVQVSHLQNSISVNPSLKDMSHLLSIINNASGVTDQPKTVVMYCAVGYRASIMTQRLMKELAKPENIEARSKIQACNLEGSIFKWAYEGKDMVDGIEGKKTKMVHGIDQKWGKLLFPDIVHK